jgi:DNA anti-recombination protein RmuC
VASISDPQQAVVTGDSGRNESRSAAPDDSSAGNLDRVRDILFGGQMRDVDRRFARVEERLAKDAADLKDDLRNRLATLEQFVRAETEALAQRIRTEHDERTEAGAALSRDLQAASAAFDRKIGAVEDHLARAQRELRQQILDVHQQLADEMRDRMDGILARLSREADDLRTAKADRVTLAALFTEIAVRLTHEPESRGEQE